jgi:hypothetical protein
LIEGKASEKVDQNKNPRRRKDRAVATPDAANAMERSRPIDGNP